MKILVLGAGGVGGYFGGRLAAAGVDVDFLVRPARAQALADKGLVIKSPVGDARVDIRTLTEATGPCDAVLLACKAYDLDGAIEAIAAAVGPATVIVPLLNGLRHLDVLGRRFGPERVLGGSCHIGVTMGEGGEIVHLNTLQRLIIGARTPPQADVATRLHAELVRGGFEAVLSPAVDQELWDKFVFLTAYGAMTTLMRAPIGAIVAADEGAALGREMLAECLATATANGFAPEPAARQRMEGEVTKRGSPGTASMLRDLQQGGRTEHEHIIGDMLARARAAGLAAPLLRVSLANLQANEAVRTGSWKN